MVDKDATRILSIGIATDHLGYPLIGGTLNLAIHFIQSS